MSEMQISPHSAYQSGEAISIRSHIAIIALFFLLGIGYTFPLLLRLDAAFPGTENDHDVVEVIWEIWWTQHALFERHTNPLHASIILHPFGADLRLDTYALLYGVAAIPFVWLLGPIGASNLILLIAFALNGYATFLLAHHLLKHLESAIIVGACVALSPAITYHLSVGRPATSSIWLVSLSLLFLIRFSEKTQWRDSITLGLVGLAALLVDYQIVLYCLLWDALCSLALLVRRESTLLRLSSIVRLLTALLIPGIPFTLIYWPALQAADSQGYPVASNEDVQVYALSVESLLNPISFAGIFGLVLTVMLIAAIIIFPRRKKEMSFWLLCGVFFVVLSLGTMLPSGLPLPFALLHKLPILIHFRAPYRMAIPAVLGLALAVGYAVSSWQERLKMMTRQSAISGVLLGLMLLNARANVPFKLQQYPRDPVYVYLAKESCDFTLLEIPIGIRSGMNRFGVGAELQIYQTVHGKPIINAFVARLPVSLFQHYEASPIFNYLAGTTTQYYGNVERDFSNLLDELNVGYIVFHPSMLDPFAVREIELMLSKHPLLSLHTTASSNVRGYQVDHHRCSALDETIRE